MLLSIIKCIDLLQNIDLASADTRSIFICSLNPSKKLTTESVIGLLKFDCPCGIGIFIYILYFILYSNIETAKINTTKIQY